MRSRWSKSHTRLFSGIQLPFVVFIPVDSSTYGNKLVLSGLFLVDGYEDLNHVSYSNEPLPALTSLPGLSNVVNGKEVSLVLGVELPNRSSHSDSEDVYSFELHCLLSRRQTGEPEWQFMPKYTPDTKESVEEPAEQCSGLPLDAIGLWLGANLVKYRRWSHFGGQYVRLEFHGIKNRIPDPYKFMDELAALIPSCEHRHSD